jgi:hypothetical protein
MSLDHAELERIARILTTTSHPLDENDPPR